MAATPNFDQLTQGTFDTTSGSQVSFHHNASMHTTTAGKAVPILLLTHGYPESSLIWRRVVPHLHTKYPLFVPDQPGYGHSTASKKGADRMTVGTALLEALQSIYRPASTGEKLKVILIGHDRGARTMHRLAVSKDNFPNLQILGLAMFDIVPYITEFAAFADPRAAKGYFHWSLLPNTDIAIPMLMAYGGGRFCRDLILRGAGPSPEGRKLLFDGSVDVYAGFFDKEEVVVASAEDYAAGAAQDFNEQSEDQQNGRKIEIPTLVVFSEYNLGRQFDVPAVWKEYVAPGVQLAVHGIGDGRGHFIVEEAPEECTGFILKFLEQF